MLQVFTTDKPRNTTGVMEYAKIDLVDCIDLRFSKGVIRKPGTEGIQTDATFITGRVFPDGQYLYFENYDETNPDVKKRNAIFTVVNLSLSAIGRNQYRLQFKELHG